MRIFKIFLFILAVILPIQTVQAQEEPERYVKIRVLAEHSMIGPGEEIWIGIEQSIHPGWYTYWQNAGDSGAPPQIHWTLPDGFKISDIHWPTPYKLPYGTLLNYGYENNVILLQKLKTPPLMKGGPITLTADIDILVCEEICIPEFGTYEITLNDPVNLQENNEAYFQAALSKLPTEVPWRANVSENVEDLIVSFDAPSTNLDPNTLELFPREWGLVDNTAQPNANLDGDTITITQTRGDRPLNGVDNPVFVIADANKAYRVTAQTPPSPLGERAGVRRGQTSNSLFKLLSALFFAILGGLILNLMPCVFPVLSIKALSLAKYADKNPAISRRLGLSYAAGVILSFLGIAAILIALKTAGAQIGWGFQLQNPFIVSILAYLLFIIGLNLSGLFEISGRFGNLGSKLTQGDGASSSFFTGVLATVVAAPCTAPFMAGALGYALTQPAHINLLIFAALGFGLALPYLLLSFTPSLKRLLPKPGAWMETFRQLLAFPMFASAAWLVWVVSHQAGPLSVLGLLMGMVALAFGFWLLKHKPKNPTRRLIIAILIILSFFFAFYITPKEGAKDHAARLEQYQFGESWTQEHLDGLLEGSDPIFVEMTAAWCITCKANHKIALNIDNTKKLFAEKGIKYLIGDWTNQDPAITQYLNKFERNGVPLYVYYGPRDPVTEQRPAPNTLPQLLTPGIVQEALK